MAITPSTSSGVMVTTLRRLGTPGVVDEHVDAPAQQVCGPSGHGVDAVEVGQVGHQHLRGGGVGAHLGQHVGQPVLAAGHEAHHRAGPGELDGSSCADAGGGAGEQHPLIGARPGHDDAPVRSSWTRFRPSRHVTWHGPVNEARRVLSVTEPRSVPGCSTAWTIGSNPPSSPM